MPGHADTEHEGIAEPEGQAGKKADFGDIDGAEPVVRIDPETDRAAGKYRGADIVPDRIAGEARQGCDPVGHVLLADRPQRKEIIESQGTERADHAQRGEHDTMRGDIGQRGQDHAGIDALEGTDQRRDREGDDEETGGDSKPFPADPFLEATPQRGQQSMHSSSRRGRQQFAGLLEAIIGWRPQKAPEPRPIRQKHPVVQSLDNPSFGPGSARHPKP